MSLEIRTFLTLSTAHVTKETAMMLNTTFPDAWPCLGGPYGDCGWFFYAHDENDGSIPEELWNVMCFAKVRGIHHILFDQDADRVEGLTAWEW